MNSFMGSTWNNTLHITVLDPTLEIENGLADYDLNLAPGYVLFGIPQIVFKIFFHLVESQDVLYIKSRFLASFEKREDHLIPGQPSNMRICPSASSLLSPLSVARVCFRVPQSPQSLGFP